MTTKAKLYVGKKLVLELEGTQAFVKKYLDKYLLETTKTKPARKSTPKKKTKASKPKSPKTKTLRKRTPQLVVNLPAEIILDEGIGLKALLKQKAPQNAGETILVIGHYITSILNEENFHPGQIEFAYKKLKLQDRPKNPASTISSTKRKSNWFETAEERGKWLVSNTGKSYVEEQMPLNAE